MSIVSWLFIFILCLSKTDYCKARNIGARHKAATILEDFDYYSAGKKYVSLDQIQMGETKGTTKRSENIDEKRATTEQGTKKLRSRTTSSIITHARGKFSGVVLNNKRKNSLVSVSWHVPPKNLKNKNPSERNPGFYSDYSGPRTCPPSHN